jgi:translation initiation factor 3 subunit A
MQEAFRSVEDIHGLMCMVKKTPKPSLMTVYYVKLTEIFWISSSHLYHAYSWFKLFLLQKSFNKNLSQKDLQLIASSVVLAALSVPPHDRTHGASHLELEHEKERNLRMANLIGFNLDTKSDSREMVFYFPSFALVVLYRYICFANLTILLLFLFCLPSSQGHHFSLNW